MLTAVVAFNGSTSFKPFHSREFLSEFMAGKSCLKKNKKNRVFKDELGKVVI